MKKLLLCAALLSVATCFGQRSPLRIAVVGLSHGHVGEVTAAGRGEVEVVGIFEKDPETAASNRLARMYPGRVYDDLEKMLDVVEPEAAMVTVRSTTICRQSKRAHPAASIHVMVEKPLAVSGEHARRMASLARRHGIHLLTNYETTWYPANHKAREMVDFGCYGANLATWLMKGERPVSVYAVLKQLKPEIYPKVDDDATILVEYPRCTVGIMASWAWSHNRKDMHIYGLGGYIYQDTAREMCVLRGRESSSEMLESMPAPYNNLTVVEILDAARQSARTSRAVEF